MSTSKRKLPVVAVLLVISILLLCQYDLLYSSEQVFQENQVRTDRGEVAMDEQTTSSSGGLTAGTTRVTIGDSSTRKGQAKSDSSTLISGEGDENYDTISPLDSTTISSSVLADTDVETIRPLSPPVIVGNTTETYGETDEGLSPFNSTGDDGQLNETVQTALVFHDVKEDASAQATNDSANDTLIDEADDTSSDLTNWNWTLDDSDPLVVSNSEEDSSADLVSESANDTEKLDVGYATDEASADFLESVSVNGTESLVRSNATGDASSDLDSRLVDDTEPASDVVEIASSQLLREVVPLESNQTEVKVASSLSNSTDDAGLVNESSLESSLPFAISSDDPMPTHDSPFEWAACLLIRDDNKILPEWLAYHYETLPLRRLIIALDPFSDTDGTPIYDAYRSIGLNISIWHDDDYLYNGLKPYDRPVPANASVEAKRESYIWRQQVFLSACTRQFKLENRTWVLMTDTDEYMAYHRYDVDEGKPFYCTNLPTKEAILECSESYHRNQSSPITGDIRTRLPVLGRPNSTFAHFLHSHLDNLVQASQWWSRPCWVLPRSQWGAQEADPEDNAILQKLYLELGFNISNFHTLRFRKHGEMQNKLPGKPIVDVSRYDPFLHNVSNPHRPYKNNSLCKGGPWVKAYDNVFRVNHYTGTAEVFLSRPGRLINIFLERQPGPMNGTDDGVVGWLGAFARRVGKLRAKQLTEGLRAWAFKTDAAIYAEIERKMEEDPEYAAIRDYRAKSDVIAEIESPGRRRLLAERLERVYRNR